MGMAFWPAGLVGGLAVAGAAGSAALGNALFDFALNPKAPRSIAQRINAGEVDGADTSSFANDPDRQQARAWLARARRSVSVPARDGGELHGWYVLAPGARLSSDGGSVPRIEESSHAYAVLCHGYAGRPLDLAPEALQAHRQGISVLMPAARGHERNSDRYIGMGWLDAHDLVGWINRIRELDPQARVALYGVSMGGAEVMMASGLDLPPNVRCIVEDCGFTSVWDEFCVQMRDLLHLPPTPLLNAADAVCRARAGYGFKEASATSQLRRARVPMLFIHGTADTFVPFYMLDQVYEACASPVKQRLAVVGAGHGQSACTDPGLYWRTVGAFLAEHLAG